MVVVSVVVQVERMITVLLLIVTIAAHVPRDSAAAETTATDVVLDIQKTICHLYHSEQAMLYSRFCKDDGFDECSELKIVSMV